MTWWQGMILGFVIGFVLILIWVNASWPRN